MRIALLLSGGVDSSVALALLKEQGHDVTAFYLRIWLDDEMAFLGECPWEEDLKYAQAVCDQFGVSLEVLSMQREYYEEVVGYALDELRAGRTPNPDMMCNLRVKFGRFYDKVDEWCEERGVEMFEKIASGHYARIDHIGDEVLLKMAPDSIKDQTYFLAHLSQEQLTRIIFPIGDYSKFEVRELAQKFDLLNKERKDSQGVCFLGKIKFRDFVKHNLGEKKGDFVEYETGEKVGEHNGFWFYTLGQRRNLCVDNGPWFVVKKDVEKNIVYISRNYHGEDKKRDRFLVGKMNWISGGPKDVVLENNLMVKLRHGEKMYECKVLSKNVEFGNFEDDVFEVQIDGQDQGIAAGQFAVFYDEDVCLGCGVIQ